MLFKMFDIEWIMINIFLNFLITYIDICICKIFIDKIILWKSFSVKNEKFFKYKL